VSVNVDAWICGFEYVNMNVNVIVGCDGGHSSSALAQQREQHTRTARA
jgi:hypothetical protein